MKYGERRLMVIYRVKQTGDYTSIDKGIISMINSITIGRKQKVQKKNRIVRTKKRKNASAKFEETRLNVISSIKNMKKWSYVETENYIIKTNSKSN
ncbi:MAG: hypothetical protein HRT89_11280, partial [Lentisphaeria bacterium]|nr:hypothetical protein [Lentisphaeria bacterium]